MNLSANYSDTILYELLEQIADMHGSVDSDSDEFDTERNARWQLMNWDLFELFLCQ